MKPRSVIKLGGGLVGGLGAFWPALRRLMESRETLLVHGGGPQATRMARHLGHEPRILQGRRVTSDLDLDIVRWTMRGEINLELSAQAHAAGIRAVGIAGADAGMLNVTRRPPWQVDGETVDFGWVGDVVSVDSSAIEVLLGGGLLPIVAPVGIDDQGQVYNVNADTVAEAIAHAIGASELLLVTEAGGLREGPEPGAPLVSECDTARFREGVGAGWIQGGMQVKLQLALKAAAAGMDAVWILGPDDIALRERATRVTA